MLGVTNSEFCGGDGLSVTGHPEPLLGPLRVLVPCSLLGSASFFVTILTIVVLSSHVFFFNVFTFK